MHGCEDVNHASAFYFFKVITDVLLPKKCFVRIARRPPNELFGSPFIISFQSDLIRRRIDGPRCARPRLSDRRGNEQVC